jgi:hypothetical protein
MRLGGKDQRIWRRKIKQMKKTSRELRKARKLSSLVRTVFTSLGGAVRYLSSVESNDVLLGGPALDIFLCALFCQKGLLEMFCKWGRMKRTGGTVRKWEQTATLRITVNS